MIDRKPYEEQLTLKEEAMMEILKKATTQVRKSSPFKRLSPWIQRFLFFLVVVCLIFRYFRSLLILVSYFSFFFLHFSFSLYPHNPCLSILPPSFSSQSLTRRPHLSPGTHPPLAHNRLLSKQGGVHGRERSSGEGVHWLFVGTICRWKFCGGVGWYLTRCSLLFSDFHLPLILSSLSLFSPLSLSSIRYQKCLETCECNS